MSFEQTSLTHREGVLLDIDWVHEREELFDKILGEFGDPRLGQSISKRERDQTKQDEDRSLAYGEITFESFAIAIQKIKKKYGLPKKGYSGEDGVLQKPGGVFVDLGSGTGKACIAAALLHPFEAVRGIETLEGLHRFAIDAIHPRYESIAKPLLESGNPAYDEATMPELEFVHADATSSAWSNADVAFIHATSFDEALLQTLAVMGKQMRKGSFMITYTHQCPSVEFVLCEPAAVFSASHGEILVYIHQKASHPR